MKSSLFWEGPIVSILYVLQTCVSENTDLIAEVVIVAEKAEGFVPLSMEKCLSASLVLQDCTCVCRCPWEGWRVRATKQSGCSACHLFVIISGSINIYPGGISSSFIFPKEVSHFSTSPWRRI